MTNHSFSEDDLPVYYQWRANDSLFSTQKDEVFVPVSNGIYEISIIATDENGCTDTASQVIDFYPTGIDEFFVFSENQYCTNEKILLKLTNKDIPPDYKIVWDWGDNHFSEGIEVSHIYLTEGIYDVTISADEGGCHSETTYDDFLNVRKKPTADFGLNPNIVKYTSPTVNISDFSQDASFVNYFIGQERLTERNPVFSFVDTGLQVVTQIAYNENGCTDTMNLEVDVIPDYTLFLPNAFTPDLDGLNDTYRPNGKNGGFRAYEMSVFDRWGNKVFSTGQWEDGWDGRDSKGKLMMGGSYAVKVFITDGRNNSKSFSGVIQLLR